MIVQTLDRQYAVLQVLHSDTVQEGSICKDLESNELCLLARFRDADVTCRLLPMMSAQRSNRSFEDYQGLFTRDGDLFLRFRYSQAPLLSEQLAAGDLTFHERLELSRDMLERMTLLNMPPLLQFEALRECNVTVDEALRVRFNYVLADMDGGLNISIRFICDRISQWMERIFARELEEESVPEIKALIEQLDQAEFDSYLAIYTAYDRVRKLLLERVAGGTTQPKTWLFRMWERIKGWRRLVKPVLVGIILVASFCYLIYSLLLPSVPGGTPVVFDRIGTLEIQRAAEETGRS